MSTDIVSHEAHSTTGAPGRRARSFGATWHLAGFTGVSLLAFLPYDELQIPGPFGTTHVVVTPPARCAATRART